MTIKKYKPKDTHATCIYCGGTLCIGKFCRSCCNYIYKLGLSTRDVDKCLEVLDERDKDKETLACIHCGKPSRKKSFCNTDYVYLSRNEIDMNDKTLCLKILQERDEWREEVKIRKENKNKKKAI